MRGAGRDDGEAPGTIVEGWLMTLRGGGIDDEARRRGCAGGGSMTVPGLVDEGVRGVDR